MLEIASGVGHRTTESGTDHNHSSRHSLGHSDSGAGRDDGGQRAAHARTVVSRQHHDPLDDLGFLLGDQPLVPEQPDHVGNLVPLVDQLRSGIPVIAWFVSAIVADRSLDQRGHHDITGFHSLFDGLGELGQVGWTQVWNRTNLATLDEIFVDLLDRRPQGAEGFRHDRTGLLQRVGLGSSRAFTLHPFLRAGMAELHPLGQTLLAEPGHDGEQPDPALLGSVPFSCALLQIATHLADDHDGLGLRVLLELLQVGHVVSARVGIAADPDRRGDSIGKLRADPDDLVGQATRLRNDPKGAFPVELAGNKIVKRAADHAQSAGTGRDDADGRGSVEGFPELDCMPRQ